mgnify:CR=1 FL=1
MIPGPGAARNHPALHVIDQRRLNRLPQVLVVAAIGFAVTILEHQRARLVAHLIGGHDRIDDQVVAAVGRALDDDDPVLLDVGVVEAVVGARVHLGQDDGPGGQVAVDAGQLVFAVPRRGVEHRVLIGAFVVALPQSAQHVGRADELHVAATEAVVALALQPVV